MLLAAAEAMAKAGEQFQDALVQRGLPTEFPQQLRAVAAQFKQSIDARGKSAANRRGAAIAVEEALRRGRKALDTLTVLVKRQYQGDPATLAEWSQLRRVTLVGVRGEAGPAAAAAAAAPEPASTPAREQQQPKQAA